ncbi:hypothetical protein A1O3_09107 [Capronia epimyces CBS 606.96]|uniref:Uncharacterized protein n=1 Tax=Capronia epimyces CBS 606.96 TaxID=1182542 RepID=W9XCM8_9EURO|nr:uncharacterized protein A1O3_09107 [Capronia epimyces CBS 606.96]EXJ77948.1 hypothetical protein A1O3_09107 [Capronia epimyces CBS 606.96]
MHSTDQYGRVHAPSWLDDSSDFSNPDLLETNSDPPLFWRKTYAGPIDDISFGDYDKEGDAVGLPTMRIVLTVLAAAIVLFATRPRLFADTILCLLVFAPYPDFARYSRWCIFLPLVLYDTTQGKLESALMLGILTTTSSIDWSYAWAVVNRTYILV